jgi:hypothetical protein
MCIQCMTYAVTSVGAAGGLRSWVAAKNPAWLTQRRLRLLTVALLTIAVLVSGVRV